MPERILTKRRRLLAAASALPFLSAFTSARAQVPQDVVLTNVSYDPTRELYKAINAAFAEALEGQDRRDGDGQAVARRLGQAGARGDRRARGRRGDAGAGRRHRRHRARRPSCLPEDWQTRLPNNSVALHLDHRVPGAQGQSRRASRTGTISRKPGVQVITPNPKTSGGARWNYLAAWGYELDRTNGDEAQGDASSSQAIYQERAGARHRRARLDHDLRAARHRRRADRLGERGLPRSCEEFGADKFEIVVPSISILAEPPVALVDGNRRQAAARARWPRPISSSSTRRRRRRSSPSNFYRPRQARGGRSGRPRRASRSSSCSPSTRSSAAGPRRRPSISPTAALRPDLQAVEQSGRRDERTPLVSRSAAAGPQARAPCPASG